MQFNPWHNIIVLEPVYEAPEAQSQLLKSAQKEKVSDRPCIGKVIAFDENNEQIAALIELNDLCIGMYISFDRYDTREVNYKGTRFYGIAADKPIGEVIF